MSGQRRHVTQRPDGQWADRAEGALRAGGLYGTKLKPPPHNTLSTDRAEARS